MSGHRTSKILLAFILIILSSCSGQATTPIQFAPSLATNVPTLTPSPVIVQASATPLPPTATATLAPTATSTPNPNAGKPVTIKTIKMVDARNGWAVGQIAGMNSDLILFTRDGGMTWRNVSPAEAPAPAGLTDREAVAFFLDANQAWMIYSDQAPQPGAGSSIVWHTTDGGQTWKASRDDRSG